MMRDHADFLTTPPADEKDILALTKGEQNKDELVKDEPELIPESDEISFHFISFPN